MSAPSNMVITEVDKELIRVGDAVYHDGKVQTVSPGDIRRGGFMGLTIFGDSYRLGRQKVKRVEFKKAEAIRI